MTTRKNAAAAFAVSSLAVAAVALGCLGIGTAHAEGSDSPNATDLFISEIHPDNGSNGGNTTGSSNIDDNYEFFEVTNTTEDSINLAADGIAISYSTSSSPSTMPKFGVSNGVPGDAVTAGPLDVTIPAKGSAVFWLEYTSSDTLNTYARSEADFRSFYDNTVPVTAPIVRVEGQAGIANGGSRTLALIAGGKVVSSSFLPARTPTTPGISAHYQLAAAGSTDAGFLRDGAPTPGTVSDDQLATPETTPTPTPTPWVPAYPTPVIMGLPTVGQKLTVDPGNWTPYDTWLDYQWFADGTPIDAATGTTLKLGNKLKGAVITVEVTGWANGVATTRTSDQTAPVAGKGGRP
jgi:hypothetical protein